MKVPESRSRFDLSKELHIMIEADAKMHRQYNECNTFDSIKINLPKNIIHFAPYKDLVAPR